jgi:hypothetical protein
MSEPGLSMVGAAVRDNVAALGQALELLGTLDAERYTRRQAACFNSSAGGHLRHVLEHYSSFLQGLRTGVVDYEARARDLRVENEPEHAACCVEALRGELATTAARAGNRRLRVRAETARASGADGADGAAGANGADGEAVPWGDSCALRELEFLLSHTIHHFAFIGVICALEGHATPEDFGVAPSTLRHRRAEARAAAAVAAA